MMFHGSLINNHHTVHWFSCFLLILVIMMYLEFLWCCNVMDFNGSYGTDFISFFVYVIPAVRKQPWDLTYTPTLRSNSMPTKRRQDVRKLLLDPNLLAPVSVFNGQELNSNVRLIAHLFQSPRRRMTFLSLWRWRSVHSTDSTRKHRNMQESTNLSSNAGNGTENSDFQLNDVIGKKSQMPA